MNESRTVVGILYPAEWNADFGLHLDTLGPLADRVEVVVEPYEESSDLRSVKGTRPAEEWQHLTPALTDAQRRMLARIECCLAIDLPADVASLAPNLRWVQALGSGTEQLQAAGLRGGGIRLSNAAGVNATAIAEFVIGRILGEYKNVRGLDQAQRAGEWSPVFGDELAGRTLGLIGFGEINQRVAARARAFEMTVVTLRRSGAPHELADQVYGPDALHDLLARSDVVAAAVPDSTETDGLMDAEAFAVMKPDAMFVNVGRGTLVDEEALSDALERGHLRAAALDVTRIEPLPADSPLWTAPRLYLSAHCSSSPGALFANLHSLFADNLGRYLAGRPLRNELWVD